MIIKVGMFFIFVFKAIKYLNLNLIIIKIIDCFIFQISFYPKFLNQLSNIVDCPIDFPYLITNNSYFIITY